MMNIESQGCRILCISEFVEHDTGLVAITGKTEIRFRFIDVEAFPQFIAAIKCFII